MAQNWNNSSEPEAFYDLTQINKRLEWLESERRKNKDAISILEEKITQLQGDNAVLKTEISQLHSDIEVYASVFGRLDALDADIVQAKGELARVIDENVKSLIEKDTELETAQRSAQESLSRAILDLRRQLEPIPDLKKAIQARMDDIFKINRATEELEHRIEKVALERDDFLRFQKTNEESRKQDAKRLTDMQGELNAYRKRNEEMRAKVDISAETAKRTEQRIADFAAGEAERKQMLTAFLEKAANADMAREKSLQEWKSSFEGIVEKASGLDTQIQSLEATRRSIKRSQDALDEATARFDRRANEISEIQRLMEERFRQEWTTFKSDDQKRWMNYSLSQEEIQSENKRINEAVNERLNKLEDTAISTYDETAQLEERHTAQLQELYTLLRGWLEKN